MIKETSINCCCDKALLVDETAIFMGINCFKCGRSAEHLLSFEERMDLRQRQRAHKRKRDLKEITV